MAKKIIFDEEARQALKKGIDTVANAVRVTIGPRGRNAIMGRSYGSPTITNDGVTIAKEIELKDSFEDMGAGLVKEVASKTNDTAGDGTTTAIVLFQSIAEEGLRHIGRGLEVMDIKRGIDAASAAIIEALKKQSKNITGQEEIKQVASISAESEELGSIIAETISKVGQDGVVTVEEGRGLHLESEVVEGMSFDRGYISPYMVTDTERMEAVMTNAPILVTDQKISTIKSVLPLLEKLAQSGRKDLVIIAEDIDGEALATFVVNKLRGALNVLAIKAPGFGDRRKSMLQDIALTVGATVVSEEIGQKLEEADLDVLGKAQKVIARKDETIIVDGGGSKEDIKARVVELKAQLDATSSSFDKESIAKRIAKLTGGVAIIRAGAATETEMKYLKHKIEDAVNATKAAIEEGVVAGGGVALVQAAAEIRKTRPTFKTKEEAIGYTIILDACNAPLQQIAKNAGKGDGSAVLAKVLEMGDKAGYDAGKDEYVNDMVASGIIDPVKVTRNALQNAASAAGTFLTTSVAIADEPESNSSMPSSHQGMPGMM